ncbi:hypothetical protein J4N42_16855 [Vibrio sp. SCSIO 43135]|uniref:hypothetical protein n=1 Tax=Vibrio sp. SCSIO 43135 TaxID=2819096 RepID=UPI0020762AA0|nr:hypothetical protein [Vibrio sp. SCSIO 43135]USD43831.1 hypothetical protein J4N42_16855 [Vibrio sp. SCSIO 43135]
MYKLFQHIKLAISDNRTQWVALLVEGYSANYAQLWKTLGYESEQQFELDMRQSRKVLPTASPSKMSR